jgi:NAD(P)H-hydrate epimerase
MDAQAALVEALIGDQRRPLVLDGGALNLLARNGDWPSRCQAKAVLTPHPGEFARLTREAVGDDNSERVARAVEAANRFGQVVVLKGARTVIASPDGRVGMASFENAALATAGTGDVLAGVIGGLLAQGLDPYDAACVGVFLHGAAGQRLSERLGDSGLLASELPLEIALARAQLARRRGSSATVGFGRRPGGAG